jgi:hypothetical protein
MTDLLSTVEDIDDEYYLVEKKITSDIKIYVKRKEKKKNRTEYNRERIISITIIIYLSIERILNMRFFFFFSSDVKSAYD